MLTLRLWYYLVGFLHLRVTGERLEEFTRLAMLRGVILWDIRRQTDALEAKAGLSSFPQLWPLARRTGCRLRVTGKQGLPLVWRSWRKRPFLTAGLLTVLISLAILSRFVWFVDVVGTGTVQQTSILQAARRLGLQVGVARRQVDTRAVEHHLLLQVPDIVWVTVRFQGVRAVIEVVERQDPPQVPPQVPGDIVAAREGIITKVLVLAGEAQVAEGDTVVTGQVLIAAPDAGEGPGQARGEVQARTWYQAYGEVALIQNRLYPTGRTYLREVLYWGERELLWKGRAEVPFGEYESYTNRRTLAGWRNLVAPVELVTHTYRELEWVEFSFTVEEAEAEAALHARAAVEGRIPRGAAVGELRLEAARGEEAIGVRATVATIEDIGSFRPLGVEMSVRSGAAAPHH